MSNFVFYIEQKL